MAEHLQAYKVTEEGVEHPFRDSVITNLVRLVDVLPKLPSTPCKSSAPIPCNNNLSGSVCAALE